MIASLLFTLALLTPTDPAPLLFAEPGFPSLGGLQHLPSIQGAQVVTSTEDLARALTPGRTLVWWHGASVPAESWDPIVSFLERGGALLHLGPEPFTHAVHGSPGARRVGPRTLAMLEVLRLNRLTRLAVPGAEVLATAGHSTALAQAALPSDAWVSVLEPRFSDTKDFEHEDGASGSRDALLVPLAHVISLDEGPARPIAAASVAIDRLRGRFAGSRWVLRLLSTPLGEGELRALLDEAARAPVDLRVDPLYGTYRPGELASVRVSLHRPRTHEATAVHVSLELEDPQGKSHAPRALVLEGATHTALTVALPEARAPGLYRVRVGLANAAPVETGFWVFDEELFRSGPSLSFDGYTLLCDGVPEPVVGTTTMSGTVHRKFLFEPNAAVWDDTFGELAEIGVNLVRTGVWSAYRKISLDPHVIDEAWLRALEAYYLTARRHGIPVVFTFFAFVPESFGGANPYFDPRALEGQKAYVASVAERFRGAPGILWDLINEPSFSSPDHLWKGRPHGDAFESRAFRDWLDERFGGGEMAWEEVVRERWRLAPGEAIGLPREADFAERGVLDGAHPFRAKDWAHFAQDGFRDWVRELRSAIGEAGSLAPVTVGQDEGGLLERPHPLYHADALEFTSMHTWWFNDRLPWDALCAKSTGRPLLVSETGVMNREHLSGEAFRDPHEIARLLSCKLAASFAGAAFGSIVWCYEKNPFMASDNEVVIGLKRVDGSLEPAHDVLRRFAGFVRRTGEHFRGYREPGVVLVLPTADLWGPRSFQKDGTWHAVDALASLGTPPRVVAEHRIEALGQPPVIVLPACRGIAEEAWLAILEAVENGATLFCSGWFETDDAGLAALRLGSEARPLRALEAVGQDLLRFPPQVVESWVAAAGAQHEIPHGKGRIVHHPLPLEWAQATPFLADTYRAAFATQLAPSSSLGIESIPAGIFLREIAFEEATLLAVVSSRSDELTLNAGALTVALPPGEGNLFLFDADGALLDSTR